LSRKYTFSLLFILWGVAFLFPVFGANQLYRVAVLPFDDGSIQERWWGNTYDVGTGVSNELVTALLETKKFRMVEREQVEKILNEQKLTNIIGDPRTAAELGKIIGVKYLIMGRVTEFSIRSQGGNFIVPGNSFGLAVKSTVARVAIDARMVDTSTAEIVLSVTGAGEKKQTNLGLATKDGGALFGGNFNKTNLGMALRDAVTEVATKLAVQAYEGKMDKPITGLVAFVSPAKIIINLGINDGIEYGDVFEVEHVSETIKDPVTHEIIDEISEVIAEISVVEVKEKSATCQIISNQGVIAVQDMVKLKKSQIKPKDQLETSSNPKPDTQTTSPPVPASTPTPDIGGPSSPK
jgi:curli biogenesis system outer membrane secretion channel CsgG